MTEDDSATQTVRSIERENQATVVELAGEIDLHNSMPLRTTLLDLMDGDEVVLVIDMTDVSYMDSSGLATLVEMLQVSRRKGGRLKLASVGARVRSLLEISRLDEVFDVYASRSEALAGRKS